ncbi:MAG: hypothetical protein ACRERE_07935 [Candidatus Entotheonellia bacterium]
MVSLAFDGALWDDLWLNMHGRARMAAVTLWRAWRRKTERTPWQDDETFSQLFEIDCIATVP